MTLKVLLNTLLIETKDFDITVYEILIILVILVTALIINWILRRVFRTREENKQLDPGRTLACRLVLS